MRWPSPNGDGPFVPAFIPRVGAPIRNCDRFGAPVSSAWGSAAVV